jgi:hypothetical protein
MKAERKEKKTFVPVTLNLETQTEVNGVYALLSHTKLSSAVGLFSEWQCLLPYKSENIRRMQNELQDLLK